MTTLKKMMSLALFLSLIIPVFGNNPILNFSIDMADQGTLGEFYNEYEVTYRLELDANVNIESIYCLLTSDEFENDMAAAWINTDGSNNGTISVVTDPSTGELLIGLGIHEIPLNFVAEVKAKDTNGIEYDIVLPF